MSSTSLLPLETIETIIDALAADDIQSVSSCARVCHAFLPLSRKHIFASIILNDNSSQTPSPTARMLERLLSTTPEIAIHIRSLTYCIDVEDFKNKPFQDTLEKITRLQSLHVWYYNRVKFDWKRNPLRTALLHLLHLPTLTHLKLFAIDNFAASDLIPCLNLKELDLENVAAAHPDEEIPTTFPDRSPRLSKFSAGIRSNTVTTQLCKRQRPDGKPLVDFAGVTNISFKYLKTECVEASREVLKHCGQLVSIYIQVLEPGLTLTGLAEMVAPSLQTLRDLHTIITIDDEPPKSNLDPLSALRSELEELTHKNILETITIGVIVGTDSSCEQGDEWGRLDKALTRSGWSALKRVSLSIQLSSYEVGYEELAQVLRKLPETQFPRLSSSKTVEFKFVVTTALA